MNSSYVELLQVYEISLDNVSRPTTFIKLRWGLVVGHFFSKQQLHQHLRIQFTDHPYFYTLSCPERQIILYTSKFKRPLCEITPAVLLFYSRVKSGSDLPAKQE